MAQEYKCQYCLAEYSFPQATCSSCGMAGVAQNPDYTPAHRVEKYKHGSSGNPANTSSGEDPFWISPFSWFCAVLGFFFCLAFLGKEAGMDPPQALFLSVIGGIIAGYAYRALFGIAALGMLVHAFMNLS